MWSVEWNQSIFDTNYMLAMPLLERRDVFVFALFVVYFFTNHNKL
jgi:hypothetical protein